MGKRVWRVCVACMAAGVIGNALADGADPRLVGAERTAVTVEGQPTATSYQVICAGGAAFVKFWFNPMKHGRMETPYAFGYAPYTPPAGKPNPCENVPNK